MVFKYIQFWMAHVSLVMHSQIFGAKFVEQFYRKLRFCSSTHDKNRLYIMNIIPGMLSSRFNTTSQPI